MLASLSLTPLLFWTDDEEEDLSGGSDCESDTEVEVEIEIEAEVEVDFNFLKNSDVSD